MSLQDNTRNSAGRSRDAQGARQPYRRQTPHISQEPINDMDSDYVTVDRMRRDRKPVQTTAPRTGRRHMGVAVGDVDYLHDEMPGQEERNYAKYLEMPTGKKSIFTARRERQRHLHLLLAGIAIAIIVLVIILVLVL